MPAIESGQRTASAPARQALPVIPVVPVVAIALNVALGWPRSLTTGVMVPFVVARLPPLRRFSNAWVARSRRAGGSRRSRFRPNGINGICDFAEGAYYARGVQERCKGGEKKLYADDAGDGWDLVDSSRRKRTVVSVSGAALGSPGPDRNASVAGSPGCSADHSSYRCSAARSLGAFPAASTSRYDLCWPLSEHRHDAHAASPWGTDSTTAKSTAGADARRLPRWRREPLRLRLYRPASGAPGMDGAGAGRGLRRTIDLPTRIDGGPAGCPGLDSTGVGPTTRRGRGRHRWPVECRRIPQ